MPRPNHAPVPPCACWADRKHRRMSVECARSVSAWLVACVLTRALLGGG